ncbi:MAG: UbiA prenyltransferase family protein [Bacteroidia bacterium]|nr:UbiA prenyltransferase family protein [Bacteroidia bacterium]
MLKEYISLLRPHQYIKNLFLFLPAFFSLQIIEAEVVIRTSIAFIAYCCMASAVYILNDYKDIEADREHPVKRFRPLAAGTIKTPTAFFLMSSLIIIGFLLSIYLGKSVFYLLTAYVFINVLYSFKLKHIAVVDIFIIALGFVTRIAVGAYAAPTPIPYSKWIVLMTFLGALFLALAKRRDDVLLAAQGQKVRKSIDGYNLEFINGAMMIMASVLIVGYISYTIAPEIQENFGSEYLYLTVAFVILGVLRYLQITFVEERSGNPTQILLTDLFLQITIVAWLLSFVFLIY